MQSEIGALDEGFVEADLPIWICIKPIEQKYKVAQSEPVVYKSSENINFRFYD